MNQYNHYIQPTPYYSKRKRPRRYGLSNLVGDFVLTGSTMGAWLIWVFIREMSR